MKYLLKERELDNSSKPNQTRVKGSPPEKIPLLRKSYSLYLWVMLQKGVDEVRVDDDECEPVAPITSLCDIVSGY
jgi:hypothetical protein